MLTPTMIEEILGKATSVTLTDNDLTGNDVVFGRGGFANRHPGNVEYLKLIGEHEEPYMDCKRKYQKLLSLCIIHHLRCKGARFLKKDERTGNWTAVKLSQCRLKISQRLRERAPFIKLEQMKAYKVGCTVGNAASRTNRAVRPVSLPRSPTVHPVVEVIAVTDHSSSDEDDDAESIGFDDTSSFTGESCVSVAPFGGSFESLLDGPSCDAFESWAQSQFRAYEPASHAKRFADHQESLFKVGEPQRKRARTISMDDDEDLVLNEYADHLLKGAILDDISVASLDIPTENCFVQFKPPAQIITSEMIGSASDEEMLDYLQVLF